MTTLNVTARGQVTFGKEVLKHLGIGPGDKIQLDLLPNGRAELKAERPTGTWKDLQNALAGRTNGKRLTIEEIGEATAHAGAEAGLGNE